MPVQIPSQTIVALRAEPTLKRFVNEAQTNLVKTMRRLRELSPGNTYLMPMDLGRRVRYYLAVGDRLKRAMTRLHLAGDPMTELYDGICVDGVAVHVKIDLMVTSRRTGDSEWNFVFAWAVIIDFNFLDAYRRMIDRVFGPVQQVIKHDLPVKIDGESRIVQQPFFEHPNLDPATIPAS